MAQEKAVTSFLGTGWGFPPTFRRGSNTVDLVSDEEDIRQSIGILLSTTVGERVMQPDYGCNLFRLLFEPLDSSLRTYFKAMIQRSILFHEPRVDLDDVGFSTVPEEGLVNIHLNYRIAITNTRYNVVYPFYQNEGSNLS